MIILFIGCGMLYWQSAVRCKELAVFAARKECKLCDVQLLDQTVGQVKVSMSRDANGSWRFWREYRFEFSPDAEHRFNGQVILLGHRPIHVVLETFTPVIH